MNKHIQFGKPVKGGNKPLKRKNAQMLAMASMAALLTACGGAATTTPATGTPSPAPGTTPGTTPTPADPPKSLSFTTGGDALKGGSGDDTFTGLQNSASATANTYQINDSVDGGAGIDTIKLTISDATASPIVSSVNVEIVEITTSVLEGFDASKLASLTTIVNKASTGELTVNKLDSLTASVVDAGVTLGADTIIMYQDSVLAGADDTVKVSFKNSTDTGDFVTGRQSDGAGVENLAVTVVGTNKVKSITTSSGKKLTIDGTGDFIITDTVADFTSIAITSTGKTSLTTSVDKVAVTGAGGAETITFAHQTTMPREYSAKLGAGDDRLILTELTQANQLADDKAILDGGDGTDTLVVRYGFATSLTALHITSAANYAKKGIANTFETLELSTPFSSDVIDLTRLGSSYTKIDLNAGMGGNAALTLNTGGTIAFGAAGAGFTLTTTASGAGGTSDVMDILLDATHVNVSVDYGAVTIGNVETININSTSSKLAALVATDANDLDLSAAAATKIVINGNIPLDLSGVSLGTAVITEIDASAHLGSINVSVLGATLNVALKGAIGDDTLIGGNGADTITGGQGIDTMTGSAGADKFVFATADLDTTAGVVTDIITDFLAGGADTIDTTGATGSGTNYVEAGSVAASFAALLILADSILTGAVTYYLGETGGNAYLVTDFDGTGYTDVIQLTGKALTDIAFTDIA